MPGNVNGDLSLFTGILNKIKNSGVTLDQNEIISLFEEAAGEDGVATVDEFTDVLTNKYSQLEDEFADLSEALGKYSGESEDIVKDDVTNSLGGYFDQSTPSSTTPVNSDISASANNYRASLPSASTGASSSIPPLDYSKKDLSSLDLSSLQSEKNTANSTLAEKRQALSDLNSGNNEYLNQEKNALDEAKTAYENQLDQIESDKTIKVNEQEKNIQDLKNDRSQKESDISNKESEIDSTNNQISERETIVSEAKSNLSDVESQLAGLVQPSESDYQKQNEDGETVVDTEAYNAALQEYEAQKQELEDKKETLNETIETEEAGIESLRQDLEVKQTELDAMKSELSEIEDNINQLCAEIAKDDPSSPAAEIDTLQSDYRDSEKQYEADKRAIHEALAEQVNEMQEYVNEINNQIVTTQSEEEKTEETDDIDGVDDPSLNNTKNELGAENVDAERDENGVLTDLPDVYKDDPRIKVDENGNYYVDVEQWDSNDLSKNSYLSGIIDHSYDFENSFGLTEVSPDAMNVAVNLVAEKNNIEDPDLIYTTDKIQLPTEEEIKQAFEEAGIIEAEEELDSEAKEAAAEEKFTGEIPEEHEAAKEYEDNISEIAQDKQKLSEMLGNEDISIEDKTKLLQKAKDQDGSVVEDYLAEDDSFFVDSVNTIAENDDYTIQDFVYFKDLYADIQGNGEISDTNQADTVRAYVKLFDKVDNAEDFEYLQENTMQLSELATEVQSVLDSDEANEHLTKILETASEFSKVDYSEPNEADGTKEELEEQYIVEGSPSESISNVIDAIKSGDITSPETALYLINEAGGSAEEIMTALDEIGEDGKKEILPILTNLYAGETEILEYEEGGSDINEGESDINEGESDINEEESGTVENSDSKFAGEIPDDEEHALAKQYEETIENIASDSLLLNKKMGEIFQNDEISIEDKAKLLQKANELNPEAAKGQLDPFLVDSLDKISQDDDYTIQDAIDLQNLYFEMKGSNELPDDWKSNYLEEVLNLYDKVDNKEDFALLSENFVPALSDLTSEIQQTFSKKEETEMLTRLLKAANEFTNVDYSSVELSDDEIKKYEGENVSDSVKKILGDVIDGSIDDPAKAIALLNEHGIHPKNIIDSIRELPANEQELYLPILMNLYEGKTEVAPELVSRDKFSGAIDSDNENVNNYAQQMDDIAWDFSELSNMLSDENVSIEDRSKLLYMAYKSAPGNVRDYLLNNDSFFVDSLKEIASNDQYTLTDAKEFQDLYSEIQGNGSIFINDRQGLYEAQLMLFKEKADSKEDFEYINENIIDIDNLALQIQYNFSDEKETELLTQIYSLKNEFGTVDYSEEKMLETHEKADLDENIEKYIGTSAQDSIEKILNAVNEGDINDPELALYLINKACKNDDETIIKTFRELSRFNQETYLPILMNLLDGEV